MLEILENQSLLVSKILEDQGFFSESDENGMTPLHHLLAGNYGDLDNELWPHIFSMLPSDNFSMRNNAGDCPIHLLLKNENYRLSPNDYLLRQCIIEEAVKKGFDFSYLGADGKTPIQLSIINSFDTPQRMFDDRISDCELILRHVSSPGLDVLSSEGATALYYAIRNWS
jgi:ankyrin repeat protein